MYAVASQGFEGLHRERFLGSEAVIKKDRRHGPERPLIQIERIDRQLIGMVKERQNVDVCLALRLGGHVVRLGIPGPSSSNRELYSG